MGKDCRDPNFVCAGCSGNIILVKKEKGRKVYNCDSCKKNELLECTVCHNPRSIWADDGNICAGCSSKFLKGEISLTDEQKEGIKKWIVKCH